MTVTDGQILDRIEQLARNQAPAADSSLLRPLSPGGLLCVMHASVGTWMDECLHSIRLAQLTSAFQGPPAHADLPVSACMHCASISLAPRRSTRTLF